MLRKLPEYFERIQFVLFFNHLNIELIENSRFFEDIYSCWNICRESNIFYSSLNKTTLCNSNEVSFIIDYWTPTIPFIDRNCHRKLTDILIHAEFTQKLKRRLNEIYVTHTGQDYDIVEAALERDNFMSPEDAKAWGLIDKIVTNRETDEPSA